MKLQLLSVALYLLCRTCSGAGAGFPNIPDVEVLDQEGKSRLFFSDLVRGKLVAINFVFTECRSICPISGAYFAKLQTLADATNQPSVQCISISLDPDRDTPERLKDWAARFGSGPRWTLITGSKRNLDRLAKSFGAYTANRNDHPPLVLLCNEPARLWKRVEGFTAPDLLWSSLQALAEADSTVASGPGSPAAKPHPYFPDTILVDHNGRELKFYSDLIRGRTIVIQCFFSTCTQACPVMLSSFKQLQAQVGDEVDLLSITVDPEHDTPERLKQFAKSLGAGSRWHFLSGRPENVKEVLGKLGYATEDKATHSNVFIIGNETTGLWKKARGSAGAQEIAQIVKSVVDDRP